MRPRINALTFRPRPGIAALKGLKGLTGLTALTALATLAVPAVASAATPAAPPAVPVTQTITNQANASSQRNGHTDWVLKYQFKQASAATLNVTNSATATASQCRRCAADGIAFQVVVTSTQDLATLNANNQANAVSTNCVRCSSFAGAYQIVYANDRGKLTPWQIQSLDGVKFQLAILRFTSLKGTALQKRLDKIADNVVSILNNGPSPSRSPVPVPTPALAKTPGPAALTAKALTTNSGPIVNRSVKMTNPGS
jgi:hypothetical protein